MDRFKMLSMYLCLMSYSACRGQDSIEIKTITKNKLEQDFVLDAAKVHETISSVFDFKNQINSSILGSVFYYYFKGVKQRVYFTVETHEKPVVSKDYFSNSSNNSDMYIHCNNGYWLSKTYFSKGEPLLFRSDFIVKVTTINSDHVKVGIVAKNSRVLNGISGIGPHGPISKEINANPTTVEEYTLLLFIASQLGQEKNMKPLSLPQ